MSLSLSLSFFLSIYIYIYISLSLSLSLFLFLELSLHPSTPPTHIPPTPTIAWERPDIKHYSSKKHIIYCFQKCVSFCEMLNMLNTFQSLFSKNASVCGNVEYAGCFLNSQTPFERPNYLRGAPTFNNTTARNLFQKNVPFLRKC